MSVNSKMTAIADELRALMGATGALTLDGMAQQAGAANDAADAQAGLIAQITEALQGKAGASGGSVTLPYGVEEIIVTEIVPAEDITSGYDIPVTLPSSSEYNMRVFAFMNEVKHEDDLPENIVLAGYYGSHTEGSTSSSQRFMLLTTSTGTTGNTYAEIVSPYYAGQPNSSIHLYGTSSRKFAAGKRYCCVVFIRRKDT